MSIEQDIRALAKAMGPAPSQPILVTLMQAVVFSVETDTCTLLTQGDTDPTPEWPYLLDGYLPTVGDVVWVMDGGPGSKFILGCTKRA